MKQLVYFYSSGCQYCPAMTPVIDQISKAKIADVSKNNTDYDATWVEKYNVSAVPTTILLVNGEESKRYVGLMNFENLKNWING